MPGITGDDLDAASPGIDEPAPDWAEQSHRSELFHSAQLSFGHSSVASSVFQSAVQYPMDRSLARSRIHGFPLTEEDGEQESRASDADSFFSASEDDDAHHDGEREAPLASQSPRLSASTCADHDASAIVAASDPVGNKHIPGPGGATNALEEDSTLADSIAAATEPEHYDKSIPNADRADGSSKFEEGMDATVEGVCDVQSRNRIITNTQAANIGENECGRDPIFPGVEELAGLSKKELVLFMQRTATLAALQTHQLTGNPSNVARRVSKDKLLKVIAAIQDDAHPNPSFIQAPTEAHATQEVNTVAPGTSGAVEEVTGAEIAAADDENVCRQKDEHEEAEAVEDELLYAANTEKPQLEREETKDGVAEAQSAATGAVYVDASQGLCQETLGTAFEDAGCTGAVLQETTRADKHKCESGAPYESLAAETVRLQHETKDIDISQITAEEQARRSEALGQACCEAVYGLAAETNGRESEEAVSTYQGTEVHDIAERATQNGEDRDHGKTAELEQEKICQEQTVVWHDLQQERPRAIDEERQAADNEQARLLADLEARAAHEAAAVAAAAAVEGWLEEGNIEGARSARAKAAEEWAAAGTAEDTVHAKLEALESRIEVTLVKLNQQFEAAAAAAATAAAHEEEMEGARLEDEQAARSVGVEVIAEGEATDKAQRDSDAEASAEAADSAAVQASLLADEAEKRDVTEEGMASALAEEDRTTGRQRSLALSSVMDLSNSAAAARQVHCAAADNAMMKAKEALKEQDIDGARSARAIAAQEWARADEDPGLWLQALDLEIEALAATLLQQYEVAAEAALVAAAQQGTVGADVGGMASAPGHSLASSAKTHNSSSRSLNLFGEFRQAVPSLSVSQSQDSGAQLTSDSEEDEVRSDSMPGTLAQSSLEKSALGEDMFLSCAPDREQEPPLADTTAPMRTDAKPAWSGVGMVGVEQLERCGPGPSPQTVPAPKSAGQPDVAVRRIPAFPGPQESHVPQTAAFSTPHDLAGGGSEEQDVLPPFCTGEPDSPPKYLDQNMTALHHACSLGDLESAKALVSERADPSIRDNRWYCALHYAAEAGHAPLIDLLVGEGLAEAESETRDGLTALHLAARHGHYATVAALLRYMSQDALNQQDQDGCTALHYACDAESKAHLVEILVSAGADGNRSDFNGRTPVHVAQESGANAVLAALQRTHRSSRGLDVSAMGACIPISPLQVDVGTGRWPGDCEGGMQAVCAVSVSAGSSTFVGAHGQAASVGNPLHGGQVGGRGVGAAAGGGGAKSFVEEDLVTGRGEVWVARPLDVGAQPGNDSSDWGMKTVGIASPQSSPPAKYAVSPAADVPVLAGRGAGAADKVRTAQRMGGPADFSNLDAGEPGARSTASFVQLPTGVGREGRGGHTRALVASSVMDLTKSVTDDWIVVDSDDEDIPLRPTPYNRRPTAASAGVPAVAGLPQGDGLQDMVNQAKDAALQVKSKLSSMWHKFSR